MDGLLAQLPKRRYLVSSSDIPDETRSVSVGADDMLVNALNQMNRKSGRYVFLDQARISGFGQLELITTRKKGEVKPNLYIRGAISQVDSDTAVRNASIGHDLDGDRGFTTSLYRNSRTLSVVSVDLHLVQYPSRQVLPGGSVSNSMVVTRRGLTGTVGGTIASADIVAPISIVRLESQGQAVRNLIELGLIELLGRHSGVPYWQCLNGKETDARAAEQRERRFVLHGTDITLMQQQLIALGYLKGRPTGTLDGPTRQAITRFEVAHHLIADGGPDFDVIERLNRLAPPDTLASTPQPTPPKPPTGTAQPPKAKPTPPPATPRAAPATSPQCARGENCEGIYQNLYDFIKDDLDF
ncbi:peptidoglycan-binding domain-containing protein [Shimia marina]|uniref:Putative peptidoglycan binding domain protein n=1 Tax=Shimia marina TaxID=321267 RepID=A0A0P1EPZ9_9RHOB|nr:peptidoglycan-binding domain-containing protein [Shimia marina]CUH52497.1 Putative peptidoglycan binding domain protein [Shimia marina]SFE13403.1 Putative peptidoglycan binding domain-containing protein [Shimia marina]